ncbi:MAG: hypothetical protein ACFCBU_07855 [Cyanophyceae cyanobacterium]
MSQMIRMNIEYIDGTNQVFEWQADPQADAAPNAASQFERALHDEYIIMEMGEKMMVIYKYNVKTIEVNAGPAKLPVTSIRGVRQVK